MKNLQLLQISISKPSDSFENVHHLTQTSTDIYFVSPSLYKYHIPTNSLEEICPQHFANVLHLQYLPIEQKICITTPATLYIIDPDGLNEVQEIHFGVDIVSISWSPTCEFVVILNAQQQIVSYLIDYENGQLFEQGRSSLNAPIPDTVYVGWGSKETQFRGSEGKFKQKDEEIRVETPPNKEAHISWRGNGEMFAINYFHDGQRQFLVFETPCKPLYRSEKCLGLQHLVCWRPTGNMIACPTHENLVIFEKNGQKRFEIPLEGVNTLQIVQIKWSPNAQILSVCTESDGGKKIHLYTCSNYKWYEKQCLIFKDLLHFHWIEDFNNETTFYLQCVTETNVLRYVYAMQVCNFEDVCGVINGRTVQLTSFAQQIVPPTLYCKQISIDNSVNALAFNDTNKDQLAIVDSCNNLFVFNCSSGQEISRHNLENFPNVYNLKFAENRVYFISEDETGSKFVEFDVKSLKIAENYLKLDGRHLVTCDASEYEPSDWLVQIFDNLFAININNATKIELRKIANETTVFALMKNGEFHINHAKTHDGCTSFVITPSNYLLLTTKTNELHCSATTNLNATTFYRRNIEQGAEIVAHIPNSSQIVLQMPRGNLETISCRLISIDILDQLLSAEVKQWKRAVKLIRIEKLNANLLFDLNPTRFLDNIPEFIGAFDTINELNGIILEFEEQNVLQTLYKNYKTIDKQQNNQVGKINKIFNGILTYFDSIDYATYISTIMIINLNYFEVKNALIYLQDLVQRTKTEPNLKTNLIDAVQTLKIYGCPQDQLYTECLLLYDMELAHFIASSCQMDPRIFEPQLAHLKSLPDEAARRFEINLYAKKYDRAIGYLMRMQKASNEQVVNFLNSYKVARDAYRTCAVQSPHFGTVSQHYAIDLHAHGKHNEAGLILKRAKFHKESLEAFCLALNWKEAVNVMEEMRWSEEFEKKVLLNNLADELIRSGSERVCEAAEILEKHVGNYEKAVKILIDNCNFDEALHLAKKYHRDDFVVSDIVPAVIKHKIYLEEKLSELNRQFEEYTLRLTTVRRNRSDKRSLNFDYEKDEDLYSDAGSVTTRSSRASRSSSASSRNRRKEARKKQDLRQGGMYEDIALIRALFLTIAEIYQKEAEVTSCLEILLKESADLIKFADLRHFYQLYKQIVWNVKKNVQVIWPLHFYSNINMDLSREQMSDLENFEFLDVEYRMAPQRKAEFCISVFE